MADENFSDNFLRAVAAELHLLNRVTAAREMFSKSYFSLGMVEKATDRSEHGRRQLPKYHA